MFTAIAQILLSASFRNPTLLKTPPGHVTFVGPTGDYCRLVATLQVLCLHSCTQNIPENDKWIKNMDSSSPDHLFWAIYLNVSGTNK